MSTKLGSNRPSLAADPCMYTDTLPEIHCSRYTARDTLHTSDHKSRGFLFVFTGTYTFLDVLVGVSSACFVRRAMHDNGDDFYIASSMAVHCIGYRARLDIY